MMINAAANVNDRQNKRSVNMPCITHIDMKVLDLISRAFKDFVKADESYDANAFRVNIENILLSWIYNAHDGIVEKALETLELWDRVIENTDHLRMVKNATTDILTSYPLNEKLMQVVFLEKDASDARFAFPNAIVKRRLEVYASSRKVSFKSLRFSHKGKLLFVSSLGQQTLADLGIQDMDEIIVHDTSISNNCDKENVINNPVQLQKEIIKKKTKKKKMNRTKKVKKQQIQRVEPVMTIEDYKAQHSLAFTKVFEELQPRLKEIRIGLNALDLQRQPKKGKNIASKKNMIQEAVGHTLPGPEIGGKAGKSHFVIQVGEVQNLYKTTKASSTSSPISIVKQGGIPTLDLHGCTKEESIVKLDESLEAWFEIAMTGSFPFVITAVIICGCGSQVLSETVQDWIKSTSRVRNAPKNHLV